ncbi:MAG: biotin/lipoyl-binding protein [Candidatus Omnitrophica bacterium]|nr:biotin/lipoyl-binding protein [Candidatus Omnitrophota bacterium]
MTEVKIPKTDDDELTATVSMWHAAVGDFIKKDADLVELVTDKATFNLPSPADGKLKDIMFNEGDTVKSGDIIAVIE